MLTCSGLVAFSEEARACSWTGPDPYQVEANPDDTTPPVLAAAEVTIQRRRGDNDGVNCGDIGSYTITVEASDDKTPEDELGFSLALVEGSLPFTVPQGDVALDVDGDVSGAFVDEGTAFRGTLEVRAVDRAGNRSEPILVSASGDHLTQDEGCTCSAAGKPSNTSGGVWVLAVSMLLALRRVRAPRPCVS
ncbi:MAG TPA: MYXO-CTERM sorting domain-containing protein [Polyangiaceae bacterium]